ncbi:TOTE conflict system archaeo-eukaryotic primase domain-containing protein [Pseudobacteroides cellulosolvens]|uniref:Type III restriction protein res subunit n=1 Tax=Pseudobacteroides cellulosolvens ATCC 35603 = DSM 2933 TaxID=398512 RepID=A0A0L6JPM4_9FIRM|nr:DEAD/DEAH box helicase family protein [Pseudobacteroides cellulosolvens]KNY27786.1 type III restriction protein res subunit [Pseudobacteroides cellulosolvens ATCC 35603 = DSM 2933]
MEYKELLEKYNTLWLEHNKLKEEVKFLRDKLSMVEQQAASDTSSSFNQDNGNLYCDGSQELINIEVCEHILNKEINNSASTDEKIKLYMSIFKGREDVYAKRWENKKKGTSGYSPVCLNDWKQGVCLKPKGTCNKCSHKDFAKLNEKVIESHLRGLNNFIAGIYPLNLDETCYFLAMDFDDGEWQKDISALRKVCVEFNITLNVERSRSGKGAHVWFFFDNPVPAVTARKFGSALLTYAMTKRHEITFKSYDRLFPNQDTMPKGGLGNLIALPLQKEARREGNSVFIDDNFNPYDDQWSYLSSVKKLSEDEVEILIKKLCDGSELGALKKDEEDVNKPWETTAKIKLLATDFPDEVKIVKSNMLYISKERISQRGLNYIKRIAAFKNPEFYKAQAMRLPTFNKPRIISCSDETEEYICLPRGCENDLRDILSQLSVDVNIIDETNSGKPINVEFNGSLRDEQPLALSKMLMYDNGVLCGTTAFGKTVVAIKLIAERKVNTLILVDKISLVGQWKKRIDEFLMIKELLPDLGEEKRRGRKKVRTIVGQLGEGKDNLSGIIDIAVIQSINRMGEVKECIKNYGMVIVDEAVILGLN